MKYPLSLADTLGYVRDLPSEQLLGLLNEEIPLERLPTAYLAELEDSDRATAYRVCLLAWIVTGRTQVPRELQLRAFLATFHSRNSLISTGTGCGKTLVIILSLLLDDPAKHYLSITISPLKRLQVTQEADMNTRYHIPTITINEDTPHDDNFWNLNVHNMKTRSPGRAQHLIVKVEQLFKTPAGHLPRLVILLRDRGFQRRIKRIHVDEAHFIHTAGLSQNGQSAFRLAWNKLDELKALLPRTVTWQALSATFPPHILRTVKAKILRPDYIKIKISSNCPNTIYVTHCVILNLEEVKNYGCFLSQPFDFARQPRVLLFFDNKKLADQVSDYLDSSLPTELIGKGIVRHYHSGMSAEYLSAVHSSFTEPNGICKILCVTSGEFVGVDFPDVQIVCTVGLPNDIVEALQRAGRVAQRPEITGLFLIFYELWALKISLAEFSNGDINNPDRPRGQLKANPSSRDRAPRSSVELVQPHKCICSLFHEYLDDTTSEGPIYYGEAPLDPMQPKKRKCHGPYWKKQERPALETQILDWLQSSALLTDPPQAIGLTREHLLELVNAQPNCWPDDIKLNSKTNKSALCSALLDPCNGFTTKEPRKQAGPTLVEGDHE
ncbi:hypothetical protein H0H92_007998, partial [Tricholoma furcatifolium]